TPGPTCWRIRRKFAASAARSISAQVGRPLGIFSSGVIGSRLFEQSRLTTKTRRHKDKMQKHHLRLCAFVPSWLLQTTLESIRPTTNARRAFRTIEPAEVSAERIFFQIGELGKLIKEREINRVGRAIALFGDNQLRNVPVLVGLVVLLFAINESDHISVLFDRARLAQV